jgi:hypothetical protein
MTYRGSCHCGRVAYEVEGELGSVIECNCSHCGRKGLLLWFLPREKLTLRMPLEDTEIYKFNRHVIEHRFCPACGVEPFAFGNDRQGNPTVAVNVRCLEGVELEKLDRKPFDGRSL